MYIRRNIRWNIVLKFAWKYLIFYFIYSSLIVYVYHYYDHHDINISIPFLPVSTIGIAVAFYIGFKNNQAYDRFWEARKIWGGIVNYSRTWGNQILSFVTNLHASNEVATSELKELHTELIHRHIAWLYALTHKLRQASAFSNVYKGHMKKLHGGRPNKEAYDKDVSPLLKQDEYERLEQFSNMPTQLLRIQGDRLKDLRLSNGLIDDFRHMELMKTLEQFYNLQGKCERINNTPFPRQFAYFSKVFTWIFILIMPFGMVGEFAKQGHSFVVLTIPFYMIVAWVFMTMEMVGDNSEDPFENFINDVPMTALSRTIEIDLREMLGEDNIPPKIKPQNDILM